MLYRRALQWAVHLDDTHITMATSPAKRKYKQKYRYFFSVFLSINHHGSRVNIREKMERQLKHVTEVKASKQFSMINQMQLVSEQTKPDNKVKTLPVTQDVAAAAVQFQT